MKALKKLVAVAALSLPLATLAQEAAKPAEPPKISVTPYGIVYMGLTKNSGTFATAEYPAYAGSKEEGAMTISARQSRLGLNANVPLDNIIGAAVTGKLEFDFMGAGSSAFTNANMRLRHAFMAAAIAAGPGKLVITAGQTDGLLNALHPESTSYLALPLFQQAGNIHRRTGQIRLGYDFNADAFGVKVEAALLNPTDNTNLTPPNATTADAGNNQGNRSGMGNIEARLGLTMKPVSGVGGTLGASIHSGKRTTGALATPVDTTTSAFGVDVMADLTQYASVRGEYFSGKGIDDAYAGIASASLFGTKAVESNGYWAQLILKPITEVNVLLGMGNEKVDNATTDPAAAARLKNEMVHGGLLINMNKAWRVGVEYAATKTTSRAANVTTETDVKANQLSLSTQLRF